MNKNSKVQDAWDDDWEVQADQMPKEEEEQPAQEPALTRAERLAKHEESQRKLWQSADAPEENHYVAAQSSVPLATGFKPAMKLLSRKPTPKMIAKKDPVTGLEQLTVQDDEDENDPSKNPQPTPEEIRMRQQRELEEKQRRYEEARAKIFGSASPASRPSTPRNDTPPPGSDTRQNFRGRGGRGRGGGYRGDSRQDTRLDNQHQPRRLPQGGSQGGTRELYDPSYSPKPGSSTQTRNSESGSPRSSRSATPREEDQVIRAPTVPDSSGRGFNFARRGAKED